MGRRHCDIFVGSGSCSGIKFGWKLSCASRVRSTTNYVRSGANKPKNKMVGSKNAAHFYHHTVSFFRLLLLSLTSTTKILVPGKTSYSYADWIQTASPSRFIF